MILLLCAVCSISLNRYSNIIADSAVHEKQLKGNLSFLTISGLLWTEFIATKVSKLFYLIKLNARERSQMTSSKIRGFQTILSDKTQ